MISGPSRSRSGPESSAPTTSVGTRATSCSPPSASRHSYSQIPSRPNQSILDFKPSRTYDLTLIKGVLIHLNPDVLPEVYDRLVETTGRYLVVAEYYNPSPVAIPYRGHDDRLFKRDFAGEIMERHRSLKLVDYGFAYRHDPDFPQDDITWFLMEKR